MQRLPTSAYTRSIAAGVGGVATIPPNSNRVAIIIGPSSTDGVFVQLGAADGSNLGILVGIQGPPLILTMRDIGTAVQAAIRLIDVAAGTVTFAYIEILDCVYARDGGNFNNPPAFARDNKWE